MKTGIVYCVHCTANGKKYVGFTTKSLSTRWKQHCRIPKKRLSVLQHAIAKYGVESFVIGEIERCFSIDLLLKRERYWIKKLKTFGAGYNMTRGGDWIPPDKCPDRTGAKNHFYGKHHTAEQRAKWSKQRKGRVVTPQWAAKIGAGQKGKINSPETRQKMSKSKEHVKKPVLQFHLTSRTIRYFPSTKEAERFIKQNGFPNGCKGGIRDSIKLKIKRYDSYWIRLILAI